MRNLSNEEMTYVNGGNSDVEKERSFFGSAINTIGGAITGFAGLVTSWFS